MVFPVLGQSTEPTAIERQTDLYKSRRGGKLPTASEFEHFGMPAVEVVFARSLSVGESSGLELLAEAAESPAPSQV